MTRRETESFLSYLALGVAEDESLFEHDRRFHHGLFTGGRCLYRAKKSLDDPADASLVTLGSVRGDSSQRPHVGTNLSQLESEIAAVKELYTFPDGTKSRSWLHAPNGNPTKLSEYQWCLVRTPSFKKWFGDWERQAEVGSAIDFLRTTQPVASLKGDEFPPGKEKLTDSVPAFWKKCCGGVVVSPDFGEVKLDKEGVKSDLGHGISRLKSIAFAAVPAVIENGVAYNRAKDWKGKGWDSAVICAPIKIGNDNYYCEVVIQRRPNRQGFYLHEVELKQKSEAAFKTPTQGSAAPTSRLIIAKLLSECNVASVSKIIDSNGEPKVMDHFTGQEFDFKDWKFKDLGEHKTGSIWFCDNPEYKEFLPDASVHMAGFLNLRNPLDLRNKTYHGDDILFMTPDDGRGATPAAIQQLSEDSGISIPELRRRYANNPVFAVTESAEFADAAKKQGYDGLINDEFGYETTAVFNPAQIMQTEPYGEKSATQDGTPFAPAAFLTYLEGGMNGG